MAIDVNALRGRRNTERWKAREVIPIFETIVTAGQKSKELDDAINVSTLMGLFYMHIQRKCIYGILRNANGK